METLIPLDLPPGVRRSGTKYQSKNRWYDSHLVRWSEGALRPVGGWSLVRTDTGGEIQASGFPRGSWSWRKNDATAWLSTGTQSKLYAYTPSVLTDITPGGLVAGQANGSMLSGSGAYGSGAYGAGLYGTGSTASVFVDADTWSLDNFGEILLACLTSDGKIYESTPTAVATQVTNSPTGCRAVCVTPERFIFAIGASSDPRNVAWCSQSARTIWTPAASNSAGSFILQTNGRLMRGLRTPRETLLWTDADVWAATYIGGPFYYRFDQRGDNCGLIGPNAVTTISGGAAYWMADGQFFVYDGAVRQLPCEVTDFVFRDLNRTQKAKIHAVPVAQFGEVWWFYPSASQSGLENDRAVSYNYREGYWMLHRLARAAGSGAGVFAQPMLWATDGKLYAHETGQDRAGEVAYIETGPLEIGNGDQVVRLQKLLPDELLAGQVDATFYAAFYPTDPEVSFGPYTLTTPTDVRLTGRQVRMRLSEHIAGAPLLDGSFLLDGSQTLGAGTSGNDFRVGTFRAGVVPGGGR